MFSSSTWEYIIAYKLMIRKQTLVGLNIGLFSNIPVDRIEKTIKNFRAHSCAFEFDIFFIDLIVK